MLLAQQLKDYERPQHNHKLPKSTSRYTQPHQHQDKQPQGRYFGQNILDNVQRTPSGHIRCLHTEMDALSRARFPERGTNEDFENWIAPKVEAWKAANAHKSALPILTIPVVFHIITDGAGAENLSAAIIQAQLDQLNIDFANLAGSTDPAAADVEVQFCLAQLDPSDNVMPEPGINRVTAFGDGPFNQGNFEGAGNIKQQTQWDPNLYMNIWVADLSGGLLGYAQFPDASGLPGMPTGAGGAAYEDGVVVTYSSVGSVANPGSGAPFNLGRTLTHEVGHWVGLRHIWGDGPCGVDDFCADTPESDAANGGCPNHTSCGTADMVENYMDYTNDACMDIFTADQKARIRVVMNNCVRRNTLPNSPKCVVSDYSIAAVDSTVEVCPPANAVYTINIGEFGGYSDPVSLSASGVPAGATAVFGSNSVTPVGSTTLTISGLGAVTPGTYNITVNANSTSGAQSLPLVLTVSPPTPSTAVNLTTPSNGFNGAAIPTNFNWSAAGAGATYNIEIATDPGFTNIVDNATGLATNSYTATTLSANTTYYWRVTVANACGVGPTSSAFSFSTANCAIYASTNVPIAISASGTPTITSTLNVGAAGTVTDVNVVTLDGTHTYISDLTVSLENPTGTSVTLFSNICAAEDNFDVAFDDGATNTYANLPCPPTSGLSYQPNQPLSAFNGQLANGTWTLTIADAFNLDGGSLDAWAIEVCVQPPSGLDAAIASIVSPTTDPLCGNPFTPEVVLLNAGTTTLSSVDINYRVDAGAVQTFNWTGSLAAGATTNVTLNPISSPTLGAPVTFTAYTSNPNGGTDGNNSNDTASVATQVDPTLPLPYAEGFNAGAIPANITTINPGTDAAEWEHTTSANAGTGTGSITMNNFDEDTRGTIDWVLLPTFDFSGQTNVMMTFDVAYARFDATYNDTLIVAVNDDCGTLYTPVYYEGGSDLATAADQNTLFTPSAAQWRNDTLDLSAYDGLSAVKIGFINVGGWGNAVYIDNINIISSSPCAITSSITAQTDVSCNAGNNGSATALGANGATPYNYNWSNGANTATANNLAAGTYTVTITDASACETTSTVTISQPTALNVTSTTNNVACNGGNDGSATINASGGTAGYQYNIGSGNQGSNTFSNLSAGSYTVTITDANGCTDTENLSITQPTTALSVSTSTTDVACNGGNDGAVNITATGGTAGYQYNIGTGNQGSNTFSNLSAGSYTVTVTDANGCTSTRAFTINEPSSGVSIVTSTNNVSCNGGSDGSVSITATGGTAGYQYNIGTGNQGSNSFNNLSAGSYTVTVTDANGCTNTRPFTIGQPTAISATTNSSGETCAGNDGSASVSPSGGTAPYNYNWSTGGTTASINGLAAGSYSVTITDANNCTNVRSVVVANICSPCSVASTANRTDASCNGVCDGTVSITPSNGSAPYSYTWADGASGASRSNLCAGTYEVTIVDNSGCTGSQTLVISEPNALTANASSSFTACVAASGNASVVANGGTGAYSYSWSTGAFTANIANLGAGTYTVTITDANGCTETASTTIATIPLPPTATASGTDLLCNGDGSGDASVSATGGTAPFNYTWNTGATTQNINSLAAGTYTVTVSDANGCTQQASITLNEPTALTSNASSVDVACNGDVNGTASISPNGGTAPYSYNWSDGSTTASLNGLAPGTYDVTVTDANGCASTASTSINEPTVLSSTATGTNPTSGSNNDGSIDLSVTGGTTPYSYNWSDGSSAEDPTGLGAGTYSVTITDANGCTSNATVTLTVPSAIDDTEFVEDFNVLPNPNNGQFVVQIELANTQDLSVELVDVLGRQLRNWQFAAQQQITIPVDISEQAGGMYFLVLRTADGKMQTRKVSVGK